MKIAAITAFTACLMLGACATVEIMPESADASYAQTDSVERMALRRSADRLSYDFAKAGWTPAKDDSAQSVAGVLLSGMKAKFKGPSAQETYIANTRSADAVRADIAAARSDIRELADLAVTVLAADPDAARLNKDLRALEGALLTARKTEMTFEAALKARGVSEVAGDMQGLVSSIDALKTVTDSLSDRGRNISTASAVN